LGERTATPEGRKAEKKSDRKRLGKRGGLEAACAKVEEIRTQRLVGWRKTRTKEKQSEKRKGCSKKRRAKKAEEKKESIAVRHEKVGGRVYWPKVARGILEGKGKVSGCQEKTPMKKRVATTQGIRVPNLRSA